MAQWVVVSAPPVHCRDAETVKDPKQGCLGNHSYSLLNTSQGLKPAQAKARLRRSEVLAITFRPAVDDVCHACL